MLTKPEGERSLWLLATIWPSSGSPLRAGEGLGVRFPLPTHKGRRSVLDTRPLSMRYARLIVLRAATAVWKARRDAVRRQRRTGRAVVATLQANRLSVGNRRHLRQAHTRLDENLAELFGVH